MAGRRPEDSRLSDAFRAAYETAGLSQTQIADALDGVDQPAVSKWARGERPPPLWVLPAIDELCGKPRGYVLRLAGYVDDVDVADLLAADKSLDPDGRGMVVRLYRMLQEDAAASRGHSAKS